jgi:hypothetical protein
MSELVRIRDVHKYFTRGSERIDVLKGVNLDIPQGDFLALTRQALPTKRRSSTSRKTRSFLLPPGRPWRDWQRGGRSQKSRPYSRSWRPASALRINPRDYLNKVPPKLPSWPVSNVAVLTPLNRKSSG